MTRHVRCRTASLVLGISALLSFLPACGESSREPVSSTGTSVAAFASQSEPQAMIVYSPQQNVTEADFVPVELPLRLGYRVLSGTPQLRVDHLDATKLVGLIQATTGTLEVTFPNDEHATVMEGRVTVIDGTGQHRTFKPGDTYLIHRGQTVTWEVPDARVILSFFNVTETSPEVLAEPPDARRAMFVYSPQVKVDDSQLVPLGPAEGLGGRVVSGEPSLYGRIDYQQGNKMGGIFKATTGQVEILFPFSEHATILEGSVTITDATGQSYTFKPGESYYIRQGQVILWDVKGPYVLKTFFNVAE